MAKKGVLRITGNTSPKTGVKTFYKVTEWYPDTPLSERKESLVTWELFRKRENGKFTTTNIKKKIGEFTFGKDAWQYTYRVEGYVDKPEGKEPMSIIVQPQKNDQKAAPKEKDILGVKLTFQDGTPVNKKLSYKDRLWATAKCQGMEGEHIIFTLWEDDENGDGHNKKNQSIVKSPPVLVDSQGYARWNFSLLNTYIAIANKREDDKKQHEYYVTAEYNGKIKASDNANANNPEYKAPSAPPKKPAGNNQPNPPKPKPDSPKGSTRPNSPNNQPDKNGKITKVKLTDKNGKEFTKNPKFGETIIVYIESKNLVGKKYKLNIWEHDAIGKNDLLYSNEHTFLGDKINLSMPLTAAMQKTGELGNDKKNPDSGEYWKGGQQEIFAEVILLNISSKSQTIDVDIMEEPKPQNNGNTANAVKNQPKPERPKDGKCPNCKKPITIDEFTQIYPQINKLFSGGKNNLTSTTIKQFIDSLNKTLIEFNIDTCIKKAFFLAQITKETGYFSRIDENLYYTSEQALHTYWPKESHPRLYSNPSSFFRNPEKLGNYVYRNIAENGNEQSGDGYKFRGRGLIQITRKKGYRRFGEYVTRNLVANPDLLLDDLDLMVRSAGWFWKHGVLLKNGSEKDINGVAQEGDFKEATRLVHGTTSDLVARTEILNQIKPILETDQCKEVSTTHTQQKNTDTDIEYHIIASTGEINYKLQNDKRELAEYFYHDSSGKIHNLGKFKLKKIKNNYGDRYKDRIAGNNIYLIDIRTLKNYKNGTVKFTLAINTNRYYMNDVTLASLLGALLDCGYEDYTFNGFSNEKGESVGGSKSHKNGMNGDLRYLRKDKSGKKVYLNQDDEKGDPCGWKGMDEVRQNKFNDALYKYGWKGMLSWKYNGKLLNHAIKFEDHHDHLHVQTFTPKLKKI